MDANIIYFIIGAIALIAGIVAGKLMSVKNTRTQIEQAEQQAQKIIADAQLSAETLKKRNYWKRKKNLYN